MSEHEDYMNWALKRELDWDWYRNLLLNVFPSFLFDFYVKLMKLALEHPDDIELLKSIREAFLESKEIAVKILEFLAKNKEIFIEILSKVKEENVNDKV